MCYVDQPGFFDSPPPVFLTLNPSQIKTIAVHIICAVIVILCFTGTGVADTEKKDPTLERGVMCEAIENFLPTNPAVVFSIARNTIICFTSFDPVPEATDIFHKWYRLDRLVSLIKLSLKPPRWSTFSNMQLRDIDKGPWRVDIENKDGIVLKTLYFSITD